MATIRIAVRKFGPFEDAIRRQFDDFVRSENVAGAAMEFDALELNELHPALFEHGGLRDGKYDVAFIVTDWLAAAVDGALLADLSPLMKADPLEGFPSAWSPSLTRVPQIRGGLYGIPFHDGPECLIYRTDLVPTPPKTWNEFSAIARKFTGDPYGTVVAALPDGHNTVYDYCLHLWTHGGELLDSRGRPALATPTAIKALESYRHIVRHASTVPSAKAIDSVAAGNKFMAGDVAMMANWFGFAAMCQTLPDSAVRGKVGIAPIPSGAIGKSASLNVYWVLSIASGSKNKQLAWRFLRHCASAGMDKLLTLAGAVGCRLSTWNDDEVNQKIPFFRQLPTLHENARSFPVDRRFPALAHAIERGVIRAIDTPDVAAVIMKDVQREAEAAWS